ncbi:MAG: hypothetical protein C4329_10555 [Chitinophagaceae bacterium]
MKKIFLGWLLVTTISVSPFTACKNKKADTNTNTTTTTTDTAGTTAPVVINSDDQLNTGLKDATKDYPGVTATANNGEVTLNGTIKRDRLTNLMQSVQSLHPKKVNNNLTIEP